MRLLFDPPTAGLGFAMAVATLALAGAFLWRVRRTGSLSIRNLTAAVGFAALSACLFGVSMYMISFEPKLDLWRRNEHFPPAQKFSMVAVIVLWLIAAAMVAGSVAAVVLNKPIWLTAGLTCLFGTIPMLGYASLYAFDDAYTQASWGTVLSVGWVLTAFAFVAFLVTVAVTQIRAYGRRKFEAGKLVGLDTANSKQGPRIEALNA